MGADMTSEDKEFFGELLDQYATKHAEITAHQINTGINSRLRNWIPVVLGVIGMVSALGMFVFKTNVEAAAEHGALKLMDVQLNTRLTATQEDIAELKKITP